MLIKRLITAAAALLVFGSAFAGVPRTAVQKAAEAADASGPLSQSSWGFFAVNLQGDTLVNLNARRRLVPASNMKLVTTGAALLTFGGDYRFSTGFATNGTVQDSTLCGNLYIIGGGDPLIGELFPYLPKPEETFCSWRKVLEDNGIARIHGNIIGDGSLFPSPQRHTDWSSEDALTRDGVVPSGLTWRGKMGDSIPDGPLPAALHYLQWLDSTGVEVLGTALEAVRPDSLTVLGTVQSEPLRELVRIANCQSDNFISETLLKAMGVRISASDDYSASTDALHRALSPVGMMGASGQMRFADGSGLSRKNYLSPEFLVAYLTAMYRSRVREDFLASLPFPGERKTSLQNRMPRRQWELRHRIRMKSGSMNGVRCFSGYILPADGKREHTIVFSLLTNNVVGSNQQMYPLLESLIEELAKENQ